MGDNTMETFWVMDTEGSGASPNEPIELGMVQMEGFRLTGKAHVWRFKSSSPISYHANRVHGISDNELKSCPTFADVSAEIFGILGNHAVLGHSVSVELNMLEPRLPGWSPRAAYDTLKIARQLLPDQRRHKLQILADQFGLSEEAARMTGKKPHNGLYDSVVTALLLMQLKKDHPNGFEDIFRQSDILSGRRARKLRDERRAQKASLRLAVLR